MARKVHTKRTAEFKAKVALAAVQGQQTVAQLAATYQAHPTQIAQWKKQLLAGAPMVFAEGVTVDTAQTTLVSELYEQIGRLNMDLEWMKKKMSGLG